jgi:hypothetical protein
MTADAQVLAKIPQRYFEAWNGRDVHALDDFFAPKFSWIDPLLPPEGISSIEGAQGFLSASWGGMSDLKFEMIGGPMVDEANSRVAQEWRMTATLDGEFNGIAATNKSAVLLGVDIWVSDDGGRVTKMSANYDSLTLLRQFGLA